MQWWIVVEAVRAIGRNASRSVLTTLGIAIGVAAVVLVVAVGEAGSARALDALRNLGDALVWIEAGGRNIAGVRTGSHGTESLMVEDAQAVLHDVKRIRVCSPQVDGDVQVVGSSKNWRTRWRGETPAYLAIKRFVIKDGAAFSDDDVEHFARKIIIGETVRHALFGDASGVGETVRLAGNLFDVVGVFDVKGQSADGRDQDDWIMLPYTTAMRTLRPHGTREFLDDILCSATSGADVNRAIDEVNGLLRERHHIAPGMDDDFNIRRPDEVLKAQVEASDTLARLLLVVAAISLVVGGIGIMNVMLVSVTQRTREIGVRLAVGATEGAIQAQFLAESVVLSLLGAAFGVALAALTSTLFAKFVGWPVSLSASGLALALASSIGVGVVFGFYPAWRASRLDPIDALRHE